MILDFIFDLIQAIVGWLLGLVPDNWIPNTATWPGRAEELAAHAQYGGFFIPLGAASAAVQAVLTVWLGLHGYSFVVWLLRRLHVLG